MRHNAKRCRPNAFFVTINGDNDTYTYEIVGKGDIVPLSAAKPLVMPILPGTSDSQVTQVKSEKRKRVYSCLGVLRSPGECMFNPQIPPEPRPEVNDPAPTQSGIQIPVTRFMLPPISNLLGSMPIYAV